MAAHRLVLPPLWALLAAEGKTEQLREEDVEVEELGITHTDTDITDNGPLTLEDLTTPTSSTTRGANNTQYASMTREVARNLEAEFDANMTVQSEAVFLHRSRGNSNATPRTPPRVQELSMEADSKSNTNKNTTLATSTFTPTITPTPVLDYLPESVTVR